MSTADLLRYAARLARHGADHGHPDAELADWLDDIARTHGDTIDDPPCRLRCTHPLCTVNRGALATARALVGEEGTTDE